MSRTRLELEPGIVLDARRALWLAPARTLVVADLHIGYVWAQRQGGQLLPLSARDDSAERLLALVADYEAGELVLLGDIVHKAVRVREFCAELAGIFAQLRARVAVTCVAGNHDRKLSSLFAECGIDLPLVQEHRVGSHRLLHGNEAGSPREGDGLTIIGHEHPAITLSDGALGAMPVFLVGSGLIVLPAFSQWAAGGNVRGGVLHVALTEPPIRESRGDYRRKLAVLPVSIGATRSR